MALDNNNVAICYPNRVNEAMISGGSWLPSLPVTNLRNRVIKKRARSVDTQPLNTKFVVEWSKAYPVTVVALAGHNFTTDAQTRIRVYEDSTESVLLYDSGNVDIWPTLFNSLDLEWEYDNFWFGKISEEDREQFTPLFLHFFETDITPIGKYMVVELFDELNPGGYLEAGRLFFGDAWQPTINASLGIQFQYQTSTEIETSLDDTEYFDVRRPRRSVNFTLDRLVTEEAFSRVFSIQRQLGVDGEVLFAYTKKDELYSYERRFLGRLSQLDAISEPYVDQRHTAALNILEII